MVDNDSFNAGLGGTPPPDHCNWDDYSKGRTVREAQDAWRKGIEGSMQSPSFGFEIPDITIEAPTARPDAPDARPETSAVRTEPPAVRPETQESRPARRTYSAPTPDGARGGLLRLLVFGAVLWLLYDFLTWSPTTRPPIVARVAEIYHYILVLPGGWLMRVSPEAFYWVVENATGYANLNWLLAIGTVIACPVVIYLAFRFIHRLTGVSPLRVLAWIYLLPITIAAMWAIGMTAYSWWVQIE